MYPKNLSEVLGLPFYWNITGLEMDCSIHNVCTLREEAIITYEFKDYWPLCKIAERFNVTKQRIGRIRETGLRKLRRYFWETYGKDPIDPLIDILGLSTRTYNLLMNAGYDTISKLLKTQSPDDFLKIKKLGKQSVQDIVTQVYVHGYKFNW